jgi:hypothetical protein
VHPPDWLRRIADAVHLPPVSYGWYHAGGHVLGRLGGRSVAGGAPALGWERARGPDRGRPGQRYWPVFATVLIERPGSLPSLVLMSVRM